MRDRRIRLFISGRVQGVCFRAYTADEGQKLGLKGWVRNLRDGRVEVLAEGPEDRLKALEAFCRKGPPYANVRNVEVVDEGIQEEALPPFLIAFESGYR